MRQSSGIVRYGLALLAPFALALCACSKPAPLTVEQLRARNFAPTLEFERELDDGPGYSAYLVSYRWAGLNLHAMVAVPDTAIPRNGLPAVVANHGYVPDPSQYGITADGIDSRPGDYYRSVPELFTSRGFVVVMPDYRGHNNSDGIEFTTDKNAVAYYAEDVLALLAVLPDIDEVDTDRVFMWSHSMGGPVSLRALLATDLVKGASFWSTMAVDDLRDYFEELQTPVIVQHSIRDQSTPVSNSRQLVEALRSVDHPHEFHTYPGTDHYFTGVTRERAADRDVAFFSALTDSP